MKKSILIVVALSTILVQAAVSTNPQYDKTSKIVLSSNQDTLSYILGLDIGNSLEEFKGEVSLHYIIQGLKDKFEEKEVTFTAANVRSLMEKFSTKIREKKVEQFNKLGQKNLVDGRNFLDENRKKEGVIVTKSGLQYKVITEGNGTKVEPKNEIRISYRGTFIDGTEFEKSDHPVELLASEAIKGWVEVLQLMSPGSKYKVFIPSELAYGDKGILPNIAPNTVLIFDIELLEIVE